MNRRVTLAVCLMLISACEQSDSKNANWWLEKNYYTAHAETWERLSELQQDCGGPFHMCWYIDPDTGARVFPEKEFEVASFFNEGLAAVRANSKWGFIDETGEFVIEPQFEQAGPFLGGLAEVAVNNRVGLIDRSGTFVLEPSFLGATNLADGVVVVAKPVEFNLPGYNPRPRQRIPLVLHRVYERKLFNAQLYHLENGAISELLAEVVFLKNGPYHLQRPDPGLVWAKPKDSDLYGLMDTKGRWKIKPSFQGVYVREREEGYYLVTTKDGRDGIIDFSGNWIIRLQEANIRYLENGFFTVEHGDMEGLINLEGNLIGNRYFDQIEVGKDGQSPRLLDGDDWLQLDEEGELIPYTRNDFEANKMKSDLPEKLHDNERIDAGKGLYRENLPSQSSKELECSGGTKRIKVDGKWGIVDANENILVPARYRAVSCFNYGSAWATNDDKGMWCKIGRDGSYALDAECRQQVYPYWMTEMSHERMSEDPYESSVLWYRSYLDFLEGEKVSPPGFFQP